MKKVDFEKKILKYTTAAGSVVAFAGAASAQIVYTDVNPDETYNEDEFYLLDVNNDAIDDYMIIQFDTVVTNTAFPAPIPAEGVVLLTVGSNGAIAQTGGNLPYLAALNLNDPIDNTQAFTQSTSSAPLVAGAYADFGFAGYGIGPWIDAADHYMGLTFLIGSNFHYGWARMSVAVDGKSFTIKDYAYNSTPQQGILAGQTFLGIQEDISSGVAIQILNNSIALNVLNSNLTNGKVEVVSLSGQVVYTQNLTNNLTVDLNNYSSGIYFVKVNFDQGQIHRKLFVR